MLILHATSDAINNDECFLFHVIFRIYQPQLILVHSLHDYLRLDVSTPMNEGFTSCNYEVIL